MGRFFGRVRRRYVYSCAVRHAAESAVLMGNGLRVFESKVFDKKRRCRGRCAGEAGRQGIEEIDVVTLESVE